MTDSRTRTTRTSIATALTFALAATLPAPALAEEPVRLAPVEVEASPVREATGHRDASAFATVITRDELEGRGTDLASALDEGVGVQIRSFGGLGDFSTISIRGSTSEQVEIFLDGIPINRASGGGTDLSTLPLAHVERIEIYRGTAPARLAVANLAGAVEITTLSAEGPAEAVLSAGFGSFGTVQADGYARGSLGTLRLLGSAGYGHTDGDFEFLDDNGTPFNSSDDERVKRRNNAFDQFAGLLKADLPLASDLTLSVVDDFFYKDEGVPGIGSFQSRNASLRTLRNLSHVRIKASGWLDGLLDASERIEVSYQEQRFQDLDGEIGIGAQDNRDVTVGVASVTELAAYPTDWLALTGIADLRRETFEPQNDLLDPAQGPESRRLAARLVGEGEISALDDRLLLDALVRFTYVDDHRRAFQTAGAAAQADDRVDQAWTWKLGSRARITDWLELRGNVSTAFREPSLLELFGDRGTIRGNPELDPESGFGWDLGVAFEHGQLGPVRSVGLEAIYFRRDTDDLILLVQNSQRTVVAQNISEARVEGLELIGWANLPAGFRFTANGTLQSTENRSKIPSRRGKDLPGQPEVDLFAKLAWRLDAWSAWPWPTKACTVYADLHYIGENFLDPANLVEVEDRVLVGAGFSVEPIQQLTLRFEALNLTDDQVSDVFGFPLPGTSFFGSAQWHF